MNRFGTVTGSGVCRQAPASKLKVHPVGQGMLNTTNRAGSYCGCSLEVPTIFRMLLLIQMLVVSRMSRLLELLGTTIGLVLSSSKR